MPGRHHLSTADTIMRGNAPARGSHEDGRRGGVTSFLYNQNFGSVDVLDTDGVATAQAVAAPGNMTIDGALAAGGVATMDVARALQIVSTGAGDTTQTATITGTDINGSPMVEDIAFNGTTPVLGQKAFATVTQVAIDIALAGNGSVGTTDILGLQYAVATADRIISSAVDGSVEDVTIVVADTTSPATATTNDTRGTVTFTQTPNGTLLMSALMEVDGSTADLLHGVTQFTG